MPLKNWIKSALDLVIQECMNEPALEFVWVGDDAVDPLQQAQTLQILVGAGIKTREEARADLGLGQAGARGPVAAAKRLEKFNQNHDERGLFATADNAAGPVGSPTRKPRPTRVQLANNDAMMSDAGGATTAAYPEGWQACHEKCLAETEGVWPPSDRPGLYRRCVRECLGPAGDDY